MEKYFESQNIKLENEGIIGYNISCNRKCAWKLHNMLILVI